ncbi:MAG: hypothetical protein LBS52_09100 [Dysgonamonadaceae bacterium]|jgi:hypothetical protein|nr:hypothetical protein [Dysgonamonadaceae bacterium]
MGIVIFIFLRSRLGIRPKYKGHWIIENKTSDTIKFRSSEYDDVTFYDILPPDSSRHLFFLPDLGAGIGNSPKEATFDSFYWARSGVEDSVVVYSMTGEKLKVWKESGKDLPGKQFFNESYWTKREWKEGKYTRYEWTFEILPKDLE